VEYVLLITNYMINLHYIICDELSDVGCAILELKFTGLITIALQMKIKTALQ